MSDITPGYTFSPGEQDVDHDKLNAAASGTIKNGSVTRPKIAGKAVNADRLDDGAVVTRALAAGAVTAEKLADQAVETGKLADQAVETEKLADEAVTAAKLAADVRDIIHPVGATYIQFPAANSNDPAVAFPAAQAPAALWGGDWEELFTAEEGLFFRTAGTGDLAAAGRTDGLQPDALQQMEGTFRATALHRGTHAGAEPFTDGVFATTEGVTLDGAGGGVGNQPHQELTFDASREARTAEETRPRNRLIKIWRRTA